MNKYYVGFELPEEHHAKIVECQNHIRQLLAPTTRMLEPHDFHVTCLFLGKMPQGAALEAIAFPAPFFLDVTFRFNGLEVFENAKGPHALVLKLKDLFGSAGEIRKLVMASAPAVNGKTFPFNPHLTLAKCEGPSDAALERSAHELQEHLGHHLTKHEFVCKELCLFEKTEGADRYTVIRRKPL